MRKRLWYFTAASGFFDFAEVMFDTKLSLLAKAYIINVNCF